MKYFNGELKVIYYTDDFQNMRFFYRETLGLQPEYNWDVNPDQYGIRFRMGNGRIELVETSFKQRPLIEFGPGAFYINTANVDACFDLMRKMNSIKIADSLRNTVYGMRTFSVTDPYGNMAMVAQPLHAQDLPRTLLSKEDMFKGDFRALLYTRNLPAMKAFYGGKLLLGCAYEWDNTGDAGCKFDIGSCGLELLSRKPSVPQGRIMLGLESQNVNACYNELRKTDTVILNDIHDTWYNMRLFRVADPDGNILEIYSYLENIRDLKLEA